MQLEGNEMDVVANLHTDTCRERMRERKLLYRYNEEKSNNNNSKTNSMQTRYLYLAREKLK